MGLMAVPSISVGNVFKKFRRGEQFDSLRDVVAARLLRRRRRVPRESTEFWALHDVSFDVKPGESLGIIGPNGAGKSTMLKILAGIMRPNRGMVQARGRVSALIELGAGFHGDLTGRENIYLNASILGMPRREAHKKFDNIVDFADIRDFLDTPIKRYSSGMHARLGFAIAIHVDPQVLLVDEVLSVGDRVFRAKCMDKMRSFQKRDVAVIFVSHDLRTVSHFCDRALVLAAGRTTYAGDVNTAFAHYHQACIDRSLIETEPEQSLVNVSRLRLLNKAGRPSTSYSPGELVRVEFDARFNMDMAHPSFGLSLIRADDRLVVFETSSTRMHHQSPPATPGTHYRIQYQIHMNVPPGEYIVGYHVRDRDATSYAVMQDDARLIVVGDSISGGLVDLDPSVQVEDLASPAAEPVTASMGESAHDATLSCRCLDLDVFAGGS